MARRLPAPRRPPDPPPRAGARRAGGASRLGHGRVFRPAGGGVAGPLRAGRAGASRGTRLGGDRGRGHDARAALVRRRGWRSRTATTRRASASGWRARCWRSTRARGPSSATRWRARERPRGSTPRARRWRVGRWSAGADGLRAPGRPREDRGPQPLLLAGAGRAERAPARDEPRVGRAWPRGHGRDQLPEPSDRDRARGLPRTLVPDRAHPRPARHPLPHLRHAQSRLPEAHARPPRVHVRRPCWQATPHLRGTDVLVASSPTLFAVVAALAISRRLRVPYVFEVRDLWPAIFVELGVIRNRFAIGVLERLELALYRRARAVVTVTRAFADDIAAARDRPRQAPRDSQRRRPRGVPTGAGRAGAPRSARARATSS